MPDSQPLPSIDLDLVRKLRDPEYRERFFLAEASAEIARQLIKLRKRREYSQAELAERAGTQQPAVSRAEQADYHNWSFNALRKLTNAMDGRLRVVIEAWEDTLADYVEIETEEGMAEAAPTEADAKAMEKSRMRARRETAASGGNPPRGLPSLAGQSDDNFNARRGLAAKLDDVGLPQAAH